MTPSRTLVWATAAGAVLAIGISSLALSAGNPVEERQATMKQVGQTMKESVAFTSPATPFDGTKVKGLMDTLAGDAKKLHGLYPAGSGADPKTAASPKVWEDKADFDKRLAEMGTLATTAGKATSAETFKPAFGAVGATCKSCHDVYRKKQAG